MYSLIGLIQFLLMLTQSKLMPAMQGFWEEKTVVEKMAAANVFSDKPIAENRQTCFYATLVTRPEEKQIPRKYQQFSKPYRVGLLKNGKPFLPAFSDKLYLVFCQLKTEG